MTEHQQTNRLRTEGTDYLLAVTWDWLPQQGYAAPGTSRLAGTVASRCIRIQGLNIRYSA